MTHTRPRKTLELPRPVVNRILAHAQQCGATPQCGLLTRDDQNRFAYHPMAESVPPCCNPGHDAFARQRASLTDKQQHLFACVLSLPDGHDPASDKADPRLFPLDAHYYILTSLNTKGVIEMQALYRMGERLETVGLELAQA